MYKKVLEKGLLAFLILISILFPSCRSQEGRNIGENNEIRHSQLLSLYEKDGYEEVMISNPKGDLVAHYVLIDKDKGQPKNLPEGAEIIKVPLQSAVLDSEVYAGAMQEIGSDKSIKGLFDVNFVTSPELKKRIKEGVINDMGSTSTPNLEKIISLTPDAIFISYFDGMQTQAVDKIGVPVIKMYDLQESTPLGRAEWIRFIGRLSGKGEVADSIFEKVAERYDEATSGKGSEASRKKVLTETMYEGVWNVAGGNSYQANLIKDAGGYYFKEDDGGRVTLMLTPEQVLKDGADSDIWIIRYYGNEDELKKILASDPVYKEIKAYKTGEIYFSDTSESGLFREFPFHPDLLLKDYKAIIKGEDESGMRYFKKLDL